MLPLIVVCIVVLSGFGAVALHDRKTEHITETMTVPFLAPTIEESERADYVCARSDDTDSYLMNPGQPMIPKITKVVELEFGVKNVNVEVIPKGIYEQEISQEIIPAPEPVPLIDGIDYMNEPVKDKKVYGGAELFPSDWFSVHEGCGLNNDDKHATFVVIHLYPLRYAPKEQKVYIAESADIKITYDPPAKPMTFGDDFDLVIIAPKNFSRILQPLINHKNSHKMRTTLKTVESICNDHKYTGVDKPEKIKYFIKDAMETSGVRYVLLFGGLKYLWNNDDRDNKNEGSKDWHVPVRYTNLYDGGNVYDPGYLCDLYYADIYKAGGAFDNWDSNGNGIFAEFGRDELDLYPDVYAGRLACRNKIEARIMVNKIIGYEKMQASPSWFKKMIVISGDGFQDQSDLSISWNTTNLPDGEYTIYAQSKNNDNVSGPIHVTNVTLDRTVNSSIKFTEDDHLITNKKYPAPPIAEITSPSESDILGDTDVEYVPENAYIGSNWAKVEYKSGVMAIRGKSYDPRPYGTETSIHVWVKDSENDIVFDCNRSSINVYYESEWETGERSLPGSKRTGSLGYMPNDFKKKILWTSNGKLTSQDDVIKAISKGAGFVHFAGHGNPNVWANHYPGIPGGRQNSSIYGLKVIDSNLPFFPMNRLRNRGMYPVVVVGGCHNSQFNVSIYKTWKGKDIGGYWTHGFPIPECWSWWLTRMAWNGAIATIGCTGLGYGYLGSGCLIGLGGWINAEFFRQYAIEGHHILGKTHSKTIEAYIDEIGKIQLHDVKTVQEWALLGDPSLMIGGYL